MCFFPPPLAPPAPHLSLGPRFRRLTLPSRLSLWRAGAAQRALLTHKDGLAVYRGRVLVQGQGVCGQLLGLTAFRLRKTMNKKRRKKGARGGCWCDGMEARSPFLESYSDFKLSECCRQRTNLNLKHHRHNLHEK